jgi:hypothetical protein
LTEEINVGPGQALCIRRGAIHRLDNDGVQDAKALCVITPATIGPQYFREVAGVTKAAAGGPPARAKVGGNHEAARPHARTVSASGVAPVRESEPSDWG